MLRSVYETVAKEWRGLEVGLEPTRLILIFSVLFLLPRYHFFHLGTPHLNQLLLLQLLAPILLILVVYRENPLRWGLGFGEIRVGLSLTGLFLLLYLPFFVLLVTNDEFARYYSTTAVTNTSSWGPYIRKRLLSLLSMTRTELFYRGFLLFGLKKVFKNHDALMIHLIPYGLAHLGKPELECFGSLLVGYFLGFLALRTRSIWYGVFLHWFFASGFQLYFLAKAWV